MGLFTALAVHEPRLRSLLRIVIGFTYSLHGYQKFFGWFGGIGGSKPDLASPMGVAGVLETVGGALIFLGLFTRPTAFLLSGQMAVAYFMVHLPGGWLPITNGGELAVLYCFAFLWMSAAGPGPWSLEELMKQP